MLSIQLSAPVLPRVTKLYHRHRRRQHRSFQNHPRHRLSKTNSQPSTTVHPRIRSSSKVHPTNNDKLSSAASTDHPLHETTPIKNQKQREKSNITIRSVSVTKVDSDKWRNDDWNNECNSDLKITNENTNSYKEFTQGSSTTKMCLSATGQCELNAVESDTNTFNVHMTNGDGETGICGNNTNITSPTGWNYNGTVTQISYNIISSDFYSERGHCYFYGQISKSTSMWQTINLTNYVDSLLIDAQTVKFNLSAWLGGYTTQDDNVAISLTFANENNQIIGNRTSIGPVLANDRGNHTSLIFRQTNGFVPVGARFFTVFVLFTRLEGTTINADVDNIAVFLYQ
ncbi:unnamed protein product [Rotaria sp. Silwood1]|nr:unnamed protein product [Rotaria sp. Silwood1]